MYKPDNFVISAEELKRELKDQGISQSKFSEQYYLDEVDECADEAKLESHFTRFKKVLSNQDQRSPERVFAYINYFNRRYKAVGKLTQADRNAAWQLFIELDTRVATRTLDNGLITVALDSLASLFSSHREISKQNGPNCKQYYQLVSKLFETDLRSFTSQWHRGAELNESEQINFREELCVLQGKLKELKKSLEKIFR
jgi:hypothetical protein